MPIKKPVLQKKFLYIFSKRQRWGLTWLGRLFFLLLFFLAVALFHQTIVPFLSSSTPNNARVVIIEGYVEDHTYPFFLEKIAEINPAVIITTGVPFDQGFYISGLPSTAHLVAQSLLALGVDSALVKVAPPNPDVPVNRTYNSAIAARAYIEQHYPATEEVILFSSSVHARRSHYLFSMVFQPGISVGNFAAPSPYIRRADWHKTSRAFRVVLSETIAWLYVRLFFMPDVDKDLKLQKQFTTAVVN